MMDDKPQVNSMLVLLLLVLTAVSGQDYPTRTTTSGDIVGFTTSADGRTVENYRGIPYAVPPTGDLRFKPPQPRVQPWSGLRNTSVFGNVCVQTSATGPMSEDCLYLNVFVPRQEGQAEVKMAAMVHIHGGAFQSGSGNIDGDWLAAVGDIIVVTLNYRLNVFGFLSTGDQNSPGNYGLMDQRAAIVWVKENIHNFGGDPDTITVHGLSAGSMATSLHMLSPKNTGLFRRVICESGVATGPGVINYRPLESVRNLCNLMNCTSDDPAQMVKELRTADPVALTNTAAKLTWVPPVRYWVPVIDGDYLPDEPLSLLESGTVENRDLLLGSNNDEGGFLYEEPLFQAVNDLDTAKNLVLELSSSFFKPSSIEDVWEAITYDYNIWNEDDPDVLKRALADIYADFTYVANTVQTANIYSKKNYNTYMYQFAHRLSYSTLPPGVGASHGSNFQMIFPYSEFLDRATDDEMNLMRIMMKFWSNFAKTGDPNSPPDAVLPTVWPKFLPSTKEYLQLTTNMSTHSVLANLQPKHTFFWSKTAPSLDGRTCGCQSCNLEVNSGAMTFVGKTLMACAIACLISYVYNHFLAN